MFLDSFWNSPVYRPNTFICRWWWPSKKIRYGQLFHLKNISRESSYFFFLRNPTRNWLRNILVRVHVHHSPMPVPSSKFYVYALPFALWFYRRKVYLYKSHQFCLWPIFVLKIIGLCPKLLTFGNCLLLPYSTTIFTRVFTRTRFFFW